MEIPVEMEGGDRRRLLAKHLLLITIALGLFVHYARDAVLSVPYDYDESDYMYAAAFGYSAQATDTPSLSWSELLRDGLERPHDPDHDAGLSKLIRQSNDVLFYRHWHGPLLLYWLIAIDAPGHTEHATRLSMLVFPVLTFLVVYSAALWAFPIPVGPLAAILCSALFLFGMPTVESSELAPHQLFVLAYICGFFLMAKMIGTRQRRYWYFAVIAAAAAFCLLEISFVLIATMVMCCYFERSWMVPDWKLGLISTLLFAACVFIIWPAAILKLSFIRAYMFMAYQAIFLRSGNVGVLSMLQFRLKEAPFEWGLTVIALVVYFTARDFPIRRLLYPLLVYSGLMFATLLPLRAHIPRYQLPLLPALDLFAGCVIADRLSRVDPRLRYAMVTLICVGVVWNIARQDRQFSTRGSPRPAEILAFVRTHQLEDKALLIPHEDVPRFHYYFPQAHLEEYYREQPTSADFQSGHFAAVLYPGSPLRMDLLEK
jgi:hypothetical protein